jgi:1-acyl-sn-glycerol-3-phosphate acyltransferase
MSRKLRSGPWDRVRRAIGRAWLWLFGWRIEGEVPSEPRYVAIAAPHTSYWDFPHMIAFGFATGQYISFLMKASFFEGPLGALLRHMGGIPVDRRGAHGLVDSVVREFAARDELVVVIAPEGSRERCDHWKSGFYRIALKAGVPIAMGFMDYGEKVLGYGPLLHPTGDVERDSEALAAFYADKEGRYPDQGSPPRLHG